MPLGRRKVRGGNALSRLAEFSTSLLLLSGAGLVLGASPPDDLQLVELESSLTATVAVRHAGDGSGRLFLVDRAGTVSIRHPDLGLLPDPFLDLVGEVDTCCEGGLLGLAFHPLFVENRHFFVFFTRWSVARGGRETIVARFSASEADADVADVGSRLEILSLPLPGDLHVGGDLHFGPDGMLYIGIGDGGASSATAQDLGSFHGKLLRIEPCAETQCAEIYTVPSDNPFVGGLGLDEIWAYGLRNPFRWSFDRTTGDLLIADVGGDDREEVSFENAASSGGLNYGWDCREGDLAGPGVCGDGEDFVEPVMVYPHEQGRCAVVGGFRYRGCISGLVGTYVFGDFCTSEVFFGSEVSPGSWDFEAWMDLPAGGGFVVGFGEDEDGELYLLHHGERLLRFESPSTCALFRDGWESGDNSAWSSDSASVRGLRTSGSGGDSTERPD